MDDRFISKWAFEDTVIRFERINKRLWILIILLIISLIGTNAGWIYYESQWEDVVSVEQDVEANSDGEGNINLNTIGGDYYGRESESTPESN